MMKKDNVILEKSYQFAIEIIELYKKLRFENKEFVLSSQLLRSGTSIGANTEETVGAQSKKDFLAKISISYKEARETHYWLKLLRDTKFIETISAENLLDKATELLKIIGSIQKSIKANNS